MKEKITILIPVFNDWDALGLLIEQIDQQAKLSENSFSILVLNDCSSQKALVDTFPNLSIEILHLLRNVGHQKAIAIGVSHLAENSKEGKILVMDADGEDKASDISALIEASDRNPEQIVFARRSRRSEGLIFKIFYIVYRMIFKMLTGKIITFGNFSIIPASMLKKLAFVSEIWNNYPGGVIRSKLPFTSIPLERGNRLAGKSKMNFVSLVMHGMSAIAVFLDVTAVRILLFSVFMIFCALLGIGVVFELKFIAEMATPGWASSLASAFFIIVLQAFFISLFMVFTVLSYRANKHFIPLLDYKSFIEKIEKVA